MEESILINDNCVTVLKTIGDNSVDLIVTDPPYRVISGGRPKRKGQPSGILKKNDGKIFEHNSIEPEEFIPELYRVLKEGSHCYIMINALNMEHYLNVCRNSGFMLHSILCWEKNNVTPSRWYMKNCEFTLFLRKGKAKPINNLGSKMIHSFPNIIGNKRHPTEKPVDLMKFYIENSSSVGDIILDPFMGSGPVCLAAKETKRKYIGIEIDNKWFNEAKRRID